MGTTMHAMLKSQFAKLRNGDYYFYLHDPWLAANDRNTIINSTLADVIQRNTSLTSLQSNVFFIDPCPGEDGEDRMMLSKNNTDEGAVYFSVYPNPVVDRLINLQMNDMEKGNYSLQLINGNGQVVISKQFIHNGGKYTQRIKLGQEPAIGMYRLVIGLPGNRHISKPIVIVE